MLFNSIDFAIFLPIVFLLYWFVFNYSLRAQNLFIVLSSYVFYGWWDWRFLSLIIFSTIVDYFSGLYIYRAHSISRKRLFLWISICINVGFLGFFKYYNFFVYNFEQAFSLFGTDFNLSSLNIILPVGISFYTFQTLSYTIDVYRNKLKPTSDFVSYSAYVSFFPQLVAGPIERATNLLPQFFKSRDFDYYSSVIGCRQILWGFFKKIVIADNCAIFADQIFENSSEYSGSTLLLGAFFFTFQIYGDFSGYSDIAIGTARLLGFNLMKNFAFPYFSRDIAEFWRRWHISLSTWFRDYLYIPLGGSKGGVYSQIRNIFIIFIVSGFWHGANWTFISWGALNAFYFLPLFLSNKNRDNIEIVAKYKSFPNFKDILSISTTFILCVFAWIFFRADNMMHAFCFIDEIFSSSFLILPLHFLHESYYLFILISIFILIEWIGRRDEFAIEMIPSKFPRNLRYSFYYILCVIIILNTGSQENFIYFQF